MESARNCTEQRLLGLCPEGHGLERRRSIKITMIEEMRKELGQSFIGHCILLIGALLVSLISPQISLRHEKIYTVHLANLGSGGGPSQSSSATSLPQPAPKSKTPDAKKINVPLTPQPQQVKRLNPKAQTVQKTVPATAKPKTPSLADRLKTRLEKVKTPPDSKVQNVKTNQKFVEPQKALPQTNQRFVEPKEWSNIQKSQAGAQTQIAVGGTGSGKGVGIGIGTGSGTGEEFPYSWYLELIQTKITMNWKEPPKPLIKGEIPYAVVSFLIGRDGQIKKISLYERSGVEALDQSVVNAIKSSNPLPPLPDDFSDDWLDVKIKFELTE